MNSTQTDRHIIWSDMSLDPDDWRDDYKEFLESRCFPRTRDKMKLVLEDIGLPFYDTFMIIEKTQGRMAEDDFWIRIEK